MKKNWHIALASGSCCISFIAYSQSLEFHSQKQGAGLPEINSILLPLGLFHLHLQFSRFNVALVTFFRKQILQLEATLRSSVVKSHLAVPLH